MGRDTFTYGSSIFIAKDNIAPFLDILGFDYDGETPSVSALKECLADHYWVFSLEEDGNLEFQFEDESDDDFDWELFEQFAGYLEPGSYYEEEVEHQIIFGGYVNSRHMEKRLFSIDEKGEMLDLLEVSKLSRINLRKRSAQTLKTEETDEFPYEIDTSFWKLGDKEWCSKRKEEWAKKERIIETFHKPKYGVSILKRFFMKGVMPDWNKYYDKDDQYGRHLDLFCFLWLHPSNDYNVLKPLRDAYIEADDVLADDIRIGIRRCFNFAVRESVSAMFSQIDPETGADIPLWLHADGKTKLIFDLCYGDLSEPKIRRVVFCRTMLEKTRTEVITKPTLGLDYIQFFSNWIYLQDLNQSNLDFILQHPGMLDWWYQSCPPKETVYPEDHWTILKKLQMYRALNKLFRYNLDTVAVPEQKEFAINLMHILDENSFPREFEEMWKNVKRGAVAVENENAELPPHGDLSVYIDGQKLA